jgi:tetratricopeptide (TPR) repeat protein
MAFHRGIRRRKRFVSHLCLLSLVLLIIHTSQGIAQTQTIKLPIKKPGTPPTTAPSESKRDIIAPSTIPADYESEIRRLTNLIKRNEQNADAFFSRGWFYHMAGKLQLALEDYTKALEIDTQHASAYYNRGLVSVMLKRYEPAVEDFSEVIKLQPKAIDAYCNRGNAYFRSGQTQLALQDFNAALRLKPDDPDLLYNRGMVYAAMGEKSKALADTRKAARAGHAKAKEYLKGSP